MFILYLLSLSCLGGLLGWASFKKKGLPDCISECFYILGGWHSTLLTISAGSMLPVILTVTPEPIKFLGFLCLGSLIFVAFAPNYNEIFEGKVHYWSATFSAITGSIWSLALGYWLSYLIVFIISTIIAFLDKPRKLLWYELGIFLFLYVIIGILLI